MQGTLIVYGASIRAHNPRARQHGINGGRVVLEAARHGRAVATRGIDDVAAAARRQPPVDCSLRSTSASTWESWVYSRLPSRVSRWGRMP
jgi:hypothetical protein